jgi:hypothetical protein
MSGVYLSVLVMVVLLWWWLCAEAGFVEEEAIALLQDEHPVFSIREKLRVPGIVGSRVAQVVAVLVKISAGVDQCLGE